MTAEPFPDAARAVGAAHEPGVDWLVDALGELAATSPLPLVTLPDDSDLKAGEAFYTPAELADGAYMYREALFYRLAAERLRDEVERHRIAELCRTDPETAEWGYDPADEAAFALTPAAIAYLQERTG